MTSKTNTTTSQNAKAPESAQNDTRGRAAPSAQAPVDAQGTASHDTAFPPVGDDGRYMTQARVRLHQLLNFVFVWGIVTIICTAGFATLAFMQGQTYVGDVMNLRATGGNMFAGHPVADLLRLEAGYCFVTGFLLLGVQHFAFTQLYERRGKMALLILMVAMAALSFVWIMYLANLGAAEPFSSVACIILAVLTLLMHKANGEAARSDLDV